MKLKKIFKKLVNMPLRFHHQDIHEELQNIKDDIESLEKKIDQILKILK
jgi:paraquat-inducible protein B